MDKPETRYKPGTKIYRLVHEDWIRFTAEQIADVFESSEKTIRNLIYIIKRDTGYIVPYMHPPTELKKPVVRAVEKPILPPSYRKKNPDKTQNCETCGNVDCSLYVRRRAVTFRHCSGWIPEDVAEE